MAIGESGGRQNDTPLGHVPEYRLPIKGVPVDGETVVYSDAQGAFVPTDSAAGNTFVATDDAGTGDVASDVNATDFSGQSPVVGSAAEIGVNAIVNFVHKAVLYQWVGPKPVTVGVGGSHTAVTADFAAQGTVDHRLLTDRDAADAHPISAITGLVAEQAQQDQNLVDHETAPDPHTQYVLNTEALAVFVSAGYGGCNLSTPQGIPDITATPQILPVDTAKVTAPKDVTQDFPNDGIRFGVQGIWAVSVGFGILHDSSNSGRTMILELYDQTQGAVASSIVIGVGRNAEATTYSATTMAEVSVGAIGDLFVLRLRTDGDSFSAVTLNNCVIESWHISEAQSL